MGSLQILCVLGVIVYNNAQSRYGVCPPSLRSVIFCEPRMSDCTGIGNDSDCPGTTMKCCEGDCEKFKCKEPMSQPRDECGPPNPELRCFAYIQRCNADSDCEKVLGQICCQDACGTACKNPYEAQRSGKCSAPPQFDPEFCARAIFLPGCDSDKDCINKNKKCCPTGKCHVAGCVDPLKRVKQRYGTCPAPPRFDPDFCARATFPIGCKNDDDCPDTKQKCCNAGVCHVADCVDPIEERTRYTIT